MLPSPAMDPTSRAFLATPPAPLRDETADAPLPRRIWEVEPDALFVVVGVLLDRDELNILHDGGSRPLGGLRDDVLLATVVSGCSVPGAFAESVERLLDQRTRCLRRHLGTCPMAELAGWWLGARERATGEELGALLWSLACDRRWVIGGLFERVRGDICVRALRLLGRRRNGRASSLHSIPAAGAMGPVVIA